MPEITIFTFLCQMTIDGERETNEQYIDGANELEARRKLIGETMQAGDSVQGILFVRSDIIQTD